MINSWKKAIARTKAVKQDNPLKMETMIGAQASLEQMEKIKSYLDLGKKEGAKVLTGGSVAKLIVDWKKEIIFNQLFLKEITKCEYSKRKFLDQLFQ